MGYIHYDDVRRAVSSAFDEKMRGKDPRDLSREELEAAVVASLWNFMQLIHVEK